MQTFFKQTTWQWLGSYKWLGKKKDQFKHSASELFQSKDFLQILFLRLCLNKFQFQIFWIIHFFLSSGPLKILENSWLARTRKKPVNLEKSNQNFFSRSKTGTYYIIFGFKKVGSQEILLRNCWHGFISRHFFKARTKYAACKGSS